ncbi:MAG: CvpA family protein [Oscillospiraceae bacterium]|nr:CvpA family protein [Oscillospiraceae bacterium]
MNFVSIIYDALAFFIIINCIRKGAKNGFAKTAVQAIGYIFAIVAALVISRICASLIYTTAIQPMVIEKMESSIANAVDTESVINGLVSAVEGLPAISYFLFDFSTAAENLVDSVGLDYAAIAVSVEESVIRPVAEPILETVAFAVSLILLATVVSFVANGSKFVNDVPIIGKANSFFGGVFGIANGVLELCIGAFILDFVISAGIFPEYFSEDIIEKTYIFRWIYSAVCGNNALI